MRLPYIPLIREAHRLILGGETGLLAHVQESVPASPGQIAVVLEVEEVGQLLEVELSESTAQGRGRLLEVEVEVNCSR